MKLRYKKRIEEIRESSNFNVCGVGEVNMGDDSAFIGELDVFIDSIGQWKDLRQAFKDRDVITDNHNTCFFEPKNEEERKRGYRL